MSCQFTVHQSLTSHKTQITSNFIVSKITQTTATESENVSPEQQFFFTVDKFSKIKMS